MLNYRSPRAASCLLVLVFAAVSQACTSDATPGADAGDYRVTLTSLCTASAEERAALAPPDGASVAPFARSVADILTRQADAARVLRPPADLDDDHRAFVQNTADQAGEWTSLATTSPDDAEQFGAIQTAILELTLGRDDLATEMDVPGCRIQSA